LVQAYSESHRRYHDFDHIADCLEVFDAARHLTDQPDAVEMAIWFHDAVYDPRAQDNEQRSAALARSRLLDAGVGRDIADTVSRLVLATQSHASTEVSVAVLIDVELSILGQPESRFEEYQRQIREEYAWVPATILAAKRAQILGRFLARERIYSTNFFQQKLERRARENIQRSLRRLRPPIA